MPIFRCKELGIPCEHEIRDEDEEQLMEKIQQHLREKHQMNTMSPEVKERLEKALKGEPAT
jgi:predicted small metal-binding protein